MIKRGIEIGQIPKTPIRTRDIDKLKKEHAEMYEALKMVANGNTNNLISKDLQILIRTLIEEIQS